MNAVPTTALHSFDVDAWRKRVEEAIRATESLVAASVHLGVGYRTLKRWVSEDDYLKDVPHHAPGRLPKKKGPTAPAKGAKTPAKKRQ